MSFINFHVDGLVRWQAVQHDAASFSLRAQYARGMEDQRKLELERRIAEKLREMLAEKNLTEVRFELVPTEMIAADPRTGKVRLVVPAAETNGGKTPRPEKT